MTTKNGIKALTLVAVLLILIQSCRTVTKEKMVGNFNYESFRDSLVTVSHSAQYDSSNIFDEDEFTPGVDSLDSLLASIESSWRQEASLMEQIDTVISDIKNQRTYTAEEKARMKDNIRSLDSFIARRDKQTETNCRGKECMLYIEVIKSTQELKLYVEGELKDTFKVSTGMNGYETPNLDLSPQGPIFTKYTSTKFPGGNYKGLGNMPYAVFLKGGYAIHGTTTGNIAKLGNKASHGCIRIHPDKAVILNEMVKLIGLNNTWVTVRD